LVNFFMPPKTFYINSAAAEALILEFRTQEWT
jgi:hypothetical protein